MKGLMPFIKGEKKNIIIGDLLEVLQKEKVQKLEYLDLERELIPLRIKEKKELIFFFSSLKEIIYNKAKPELLFVIDKENKKILVDGYNLSALLENNVSERDIVLNLEEYEVINISREVGLQYEVLKEKTIDVLKKTIKDTFKNNLYTETFDASSIKKVLKDLSEEKKIKDLEDMDFELSLKEVKKSVYNDGLDIFCTWDIEEELDLLESFIRTNIEESVKKCIGTLGLYNSNILSIFNICNLVESVINEFVLDIRLANIKRKLESFKDYEKVIEILKILSDSKAKNLSINDCKVVNEIGIRGYEFDDFEKLGDMIEIGTCSCSVILSGIDTIKYRNKVVYQKK